MPKDILKPCILAVDDTPENIDVISGLLRDDYRVKVALNGVRALKIAQSDSPPDLVLLDIMMPEIDGYEVCRQLKNNPLTKNIPVIFLTAKSEVEDEAKGFELGAVDYITKPISPSLVKARVKTHLALYDQNRTLEEKVRERTVELNATRLEVIRQLGRAAEFKDNETGLHVVRMSYYSKIIAEALGMSEDQVDLLLHASPMHDIGKIGIPDCVLLKPGKLDDDEWAIMRQHPIMGEEIIGNNKSSLMEMARLVALGHHEKWNGQGYPSSIAGEEIPLVGRIAAIADVFDALTSERPYKQAWSVERAVALIQEESGVHFDPNLVSLFVERLPDIISIKEMYTEKNNTPTNEI